MSEWDGGAHFVKAYHNLLYDSRLRNGDAVVWLVMRDLANRQNHQCTASVGTLCTLLGVSRTTLIPARKRLVKAGWCNEKARWNDTKIFTMLISKSAAQYSQKRNTGANENPEIRILDGIKGESNKIDIFKIQMEKLVRMVPFQGIPVGGDYIESKTWAALNRALLPYLVSKFNTIEEVEEWGKAWIEYYSKNGDEYDKRAASLFAFAQKVTHYTAGITAYATRMKRKKSRQ